MLVAGILSFGGDGDMQVMGRQMGRAGGARRTASARGDGVDPGVERPTPGLAANGVRHPVAGASGCAAEDS